MLEPDSISYYKDLFTPPENFRLEKAVGTTFTLTLDSLLLVPFCLARRSMSEAEAYYKQGNGNNPQDELEEPPSLIDGVKRNAKKISFFCQKGHIDIPENYTSLYYDLESMIVETAPESGTFHPKVWLLHFVDNSGQSSYRFICASKNLTLNTSRDVVINTEGKPTEGSAAENDDILNWLRYLDTLNQESANHHSEHIGSFLDEIPRVDFSSPDSELFSSPKFCFQPGAKIEGKSLLADEFPDDFDECFICSPFLQNNIVNRISDRKSDSQRSIHILSRKETIDKEFEESQRNFEFYTLQKTGSTTDQKLSYDRLHAKFYLFQKEEETVWYIGSANATNPGLGGTGKTNTEFLVKLTSDHPKATINRLLGFKEEDKSNKLRFSNMLVRGIKPGEESKKEQQRENERELNEFRDKFINAEFKLYFQEEQDSSTYRVFLESTFKKSDFSKNMVEGKLFLLGAETNKVPLSKLFSQSRVELGQVKLAGVTAFVGVNIAHGSDSKVKEDFLIKGSIEEGPSDKQRENVIYRKLLEHSDRLIEFLYYLLADDETFHHISEMKSSAASTPGSGQGGNNFFHAPITDQLLDRIASGNEDLSGMENFFNQMRKMQQNENVDLPEQLNNFIKHVWEPVKEAYQS